MHKSTAVQHNATPLIQELYITTCTVQASAAGLVAPLIELYTAQRVLVVHVKLHDGAVVEGETQTSVDDDTRVPHTRLDTQSAQQQCQLRQQSTDRVTLPARSACTSRLLYSEHKTKQDSFAGCRPASSEGGLSRHLLFLFAHRLAICHPPGRLLDAS